MNVLIIPEDFRKDQYILGPIVTKLLGAAGKPQASVRVCLDPLLGGVTEAMKWERLSEIIDMYRGMVQLFLLLVDRDGNETRRLRLNELEAKAAQVLDDDRIFIAEHAWQEIEVWALASIRRLPKGWNWTDIREEIDPKEAYFAPYVEQRGLADEPGQGRVTLGREAAQNYRRVKSRCPEDIGQLEKRVRAWVKKHR